MPVFTSMSRSFVSEWLSAVSILAVGLVVGCGPTPKGGENGADASDAADVSDATGDGACKHRVDGSCVCLYDGSNEGVCRNQPFDRDGSCRKPKSYERTESTCSDGLDNNCNGEVDCQDSDCAGDSCGLGEGTAHCVGNACEEDVCHDGRDNDQDGDPDCGDGNCTGEVCDPSSGTKCPTAKKFEQDETACDDTDNDCDGATDEGCACTYDPTEPDKVDTDSSHQNGVCRNQMRDSSGVCPKPSKFEADQNKTESNCDGIDNDCDGMVDDGCGCIYDPGEPNKMDTDGTHAHGVCLSRPVDASGSCTKPSGFETRTDQESSCMIDDNDCDGAIDEGCSCTYDPTETNADDTDGSHADGVCVGQARNLNGNCTRPGDFESATPSETLCDGKDNDCDGALDESCACTYDPGETDDADTDGSHSAGVCPGQTRDTSGVCSKPSDFGSTDDENSSGNCDNKDNDCDGGTDEFCPCDYTMSSDGVCANQTRDASGTCQQPAAYESPEALKCSDNKDNDCDGATDEDISGPKSAGDSCTDDCQCDTGLCNSNDVCAHRMFVTSATFTGKRNGLTGADSDCDTAAGNAGLDGTWKAVLSDANSDAKSRLSIGGPVYRVDGVKLADGAGDLWDGTLDNPPNIDEYGAQLATNALAWTGTSPSGTANSPYCNSWTSNGTLSTGRVGNSSLTSGDWVDTAKSGCGKKRHLYCVNGQ